MIYIACGANLTSKYGEPIETIRASYKALEAQNIKIIHKSRIWLTAPVPFDESQPWYHNSVIAVETKLSSQELLVTMQNIEKEFGRVRSVLNAPRVLDLDLIAYHNKVIHNGDDFILPHPRCHERLFVLKPLEDIDENWTHPKTGHGLAKMINSCDQNQQARPIEGSDV